MPAEARATEPEAALPRGFPELQPRKVVLLRAGGVVDVWRAELPDGVEVALKILKHRWLGHAGAVALLRREHRLLEALRDPHIVTPVAYVERPGRCVLALEYLGCGDLVPLAGAPPRRWIGAALDVVHALERVHDAGFVHCDVKASNVLFASAERAKLADLGSAVAAGEPLRRGGRTAAHAPRNPWLAADIAAESAPAAPALDVYALAVLLYELLTGGLPFEPEADAAGGHVAATAVAEALGPPLAAACRRTPAVAALAECVLATLTANDRAGVGTLRAFRNVIESVRSRAG